MKKLPVIVLSLMLLIGFGASAFADSSTSLFEEIYTTGFNDKTLKQIDKDIMTSLGDLEEAPSEADISEEKALPEEAFKTKDILPEETNSSK